MQEEIFIGKLLKAYLADGETLDTNAAIAACGANFKSEDVPLEADY